MSASNSIGDFNFLALEGNPEALREEVELVQRPGVDGVAIWLSGNRGRSFQLRSSVDCPSLADARSAYTQYCALIGADPVSLVWAALDLNAAEDFKVAVLEVKPLLIAPLLASAGGMNAPSGAICECVWTLIPIKNLTA